MTQATIKTHVEGFNNLPARQEVLKGLEKYEILPKWKPVDLIQDELYRNAGDTLVLGIPEKEATFAAGFNIGKFATDFSADEFHCRREIIDNKPHFVARLWWD